MKRAFGVSAESVELLKNGDLKMAIQYLNTTFLLVDTTTGGEELVVMIIPKEEVESSDGEVEAEPKQVIFAAS